MATRPRSLALLALLIALPLALPTAVSLARAPLRGPDLGGSNGYVLGSDLPIATDCGLAGTDMNTGQVCFPLSGEESTVDIRVWDDLVFPVAAFAYFKDDETGTEIPSPNGWFCFAASFDVPRGVILNGEMYNATSLYVKPAGPLFGTGIFVPPGCGAIATATTGHVDVWYE